MKKIKKSDSWSAAFFNTPGPESVTEALILAIKGLLMGAADIIPGVSGGTIALITGIYEKLIQAIRSVNARFVGRLGHLDFKGALGEIHLRFLMALFGGIFVSIISLARLMNYLLHHHPVYTWSLFFGLICASVLIVGRRVSDWRWQHPLLVLLGALFALIIVNLIPVQTPTAYWFIFLSGAVAICAMILPGISGAFILLILGKYEYVTATLKNPFVWDNFLIIIVFSIGCGCGLVAFSRLLGYLLKHFHHATLSFLTGLMAGSLWKIWPWKMALTTTVIRNKVHVLTERNIWPSQLDSQVLGAIILAFLGAGAVLWLDHWANKTAN